MLFTGSQQIEKWLDGFGVEYELREIPFHKIDRAKSRKNMARLASPMTPDHVDKLTMSALDDAVFPACICHKDGAKYVLLDGNHRDEANLRNGGSDPLCYVVKTDDRVLLDAITRRANRDLNGEPQSKEEAIQHAVYLVRHHKMAIVEAARLMRISKTTINNHLAVRTIREELTEYTPAVAKATNQQLLAIKPLSGIANVAAALVEAAVSQGLTADQTRNMAVAINELPKEEDTRLSAINTYVKEHLRPIKKRAAPGDKHVKAGNKLRYTFTVLSAHLRKFPDCASNAITGIDDRAVIRRICEEVTDLVSALKASAK